MLLFLPKYVLKKHEIFNKTVFIWHLFLNISFKKSKYWIENQTNKQEPLMVTGVGTSVGTRLNEIWIDYRT